MSMLRNSVLLPRLSLLIFLDFNMWKIYLLGILGQMAIFLWFRMFRPTGKEDTYGQDGAA